MSAPTTPTNAAPLVPYLIDLPEQVDRFLQAQAAHYFIPETEVARQILIRAYHKAIASTQPEALQP